MPVRSGQANCSVAGEDGGADAVEGDGGVGGAVAGAGGVCGGEEGEGAERGGGLERLLAFCFQLFAASMRITFQ